MRKRGLLLLVTLCAAAILAVGLGLAVRRAGAQTPQVGCPAGTLTVRTGQRFYFTVVVSDVLDLYAWQADVTHNPDYLAYDGIVIGNLLKSDRAAQHAIGPVETSGRLDDVAVTRLSRHSGQDGSGTIAYLFFTALQDTGTGSTSAKVSNAVLVDRNALEIDKSYINSGNCRAAIDDDAPLLVQPPVGDKVYLPMVIR
jgi:hypothetical protein